MTSAASEACCWAILKRHAKDEIALLRLNQLCRDNDRVSSLVSVYNATPDRMLVLDLSRQRMTLETLNHLLRLANSRSLRKYITALSWGNNDPQQPVLPKRLLSSSFTGATSTAGISFDVDNKSFLRFRDRAEEYQRQQSQSDHRQSSASNENGSDSFYPIPSLHLCLRAPANRGHEMFTADGSNILVHVHSEWERIRLLSDNFRRGKLRGVTGSMMKDVVGKVIIISTSVHSKVIIYYYCLKICPLTRFSHGCSCRQRRTVTSFALLLPGSFERRRWHPCTLCRS